ncbi:MAG: hypothetical protein EWV53_20990 [Microcystis panniformis Mp_MB_F_20051200_S9]|uniref:Uncharacterized protein n=1 Tax=Microcystis panniformis Mp_MB_F_20051200_S9 TaxID=2486223 RepID=A0A552PK80_9CHRO|nr:MAG: hypothetical protein EWV43_20805 [Microcystis panniformis Mp_MB_F_20080800_S26D]TRV46378.1 MAG: hypothetical protein EWV87_15875 [Microcystis panniformis Mp_GB_SS_20050300_S99]TRV49260.1 MAG: hypothetical protein EWV42_13290 [Microcystis panniformis Mp_GB_SS_20050300_S99D]TRV55794.1 MAG: hypothetical protein EWV69_19590 [Microcystis panniformis Mp_MB_F_20080800_S26]TRV57380.1 MAG: hypothetical protein EWV53_20990 [Microcystis panniformis Mp_MB_F_20051200_S9]TRV67004.1 MAG: hypothetical
MPVWSERLPFSNDPILAKKNSRLTAAGSFLGKWGSGEVGKWGSGEIELKPQHPRNAHAVTTPTPKTCPLSPISYLLKYKVSITKTDF